MNLTHFTLITVVTAKTVSVKAILINILMIYLSLYNFEFKSILVTDIILSYKIKRYQNLDFRKSKRCV